MAKKAARTQAIGSGTSEPTIGVAAEMEPPKKTPAPPAAKPAPNPKPLDLTKALDDLHGHLDGAKEAADAIVVGLPQLGIEEVRIQGLVGRLAAAALKVEGSNGLNLRVRTAEQLARRRARRISTEVV